MKNLYTIFNYLGQLRIKTKLIITYIVLITLPISILSVRYFYSSKDTILELARQNVLVIVKKNNQLIDEKLSNMYEKSLGMDVDCGLFNIFNYQNLDDSYNRLVQDKEVTRIINDYARSQDIYSVELVSSQYNFGDKSKNIVPTDKFKQSALYARAAGYGSRFTWIPTYDFTDMFNMPELKTSDLKYRYLFSAARTLNLSCVNNGNINHLKNNIDAPLLVVNFKDDLYRNVFTDSVSIKESSYFVADRNGNIVSHQNQSKLATVEHAPWMRELAAKGTGTSLIDVDGTKMIVCYDTSKITGWISAVLIPPDALMKDILNTTKTYMLYLSVLLIFLSVLFAYWFSARISRPILKIVQAIKKVGIGDFSSKIKEVSGPELGLLINKFNEMNDKIKDLIDENYVVTIREKETEIMALNVQLNPHFLYNTLNIINWMALNGEKEKTSKMLISLSRMLQYTSANREETTILSKDLDWLNEYIFIMTNRFEGRVSVQSHINPLLMDLKVPKLFLQPFVENAIVHGFNKTGSGGVIQIYGWNQEDTVYFSIEDNGCGFDAHKLQDICRNDSNHSGIKNVDKRIKLLYGNEYGVQIESEPGKGTRILITIPLVSSAKIAVG